MHEAALAQAALPVPSRILRLPLLPYSLGHELFLIRCGNPLVCLSEPEFDQLPIARQIEAISLAALACCQTWRENTTQRHRWLWLWHFLNRRANWALAIADFRNYREAGGLAFKAELPSGEHTGPVRFLGAPELLILYQFILAHIPASQWPTPCAWDFPLSLARMHKQCADEQAGGLEIYNYRQWAHDKYVAEQEAERLATEKTAADAPAAVTPPP